MNTIKLPNCPVKIISHRGMSGLERENTCAAFVAAGNRDSIYGIETDVHRTSDGRFVIFHDDDTARVGLDHLVIEESTFQTLRSLQLTDMDGRRGRADLVIPSPEEYIGICKRYEKAAIFELKNEMPAEDVWRMAELFREMDYLDRVTFISFKLNNLIALRERYPDVSAQYLLKEWGEDSLDILRTYNLGLDIRHTDLTKEAADAVHGIGQEVNCWTVNTAEDALAAIEKGTDYITSNILEPQV